ncbi:MAG: MFS transporter, partial [Pseudomonadota bacterium]
AAYSMSTLFSAMKPIVLTGFVKEQGLPDLWAGVLAATPFIGIASAALLGAKVAARQRFTAIVLVLGTLLAVSELATAALVALPWAVFALQFLAGLCVGLLMGVGSACITRTSVAPALFGLVDMTAVLLMSFMVAAVGLAMEQRGLPGAFQLAAGVCAVLTVLALGFSRSTPPAGDASAVEPSIHEPLTISLRHLAVVLMGVLFVTASGLGFAYMFTLADRLGLDYAVAGERIGVLLFLSAFACLAGGWCAARFGPYRPLAVAYVVCAMGWVLATQADSIAAFLGGLVLGVFSLQFCFPVLLALASSLDAAGRWAAIATPVQTSGFAWAAIVAGWLVGLWQLEAIGYACVLGMAGCLVLLRFSRPEAARSHPHALR